MQNLITKELEAAVMSNLRCVLKPPDKALIKPCISPAPRKLNPFFSDAFSLALYRAHLKLFSFANPVT